MDVEQEFDYDETKGIMTVIPRAPFTLKLYRMWKALTVAENLTLRDQFILKYPSEDEGHMFHAMMAAFFLWNITDERELRAYEVANRTNPIQLHHKMKREVIITALKIQNEIDLLKNPRDNFKENKAVIEAIAKESLTYKQQDNEDNLPTGADAVAEKDLLSEGDVSKKDVKFTDSDEQELTAEETECIERVISEFVENLRVHLYKTATTFREQQKETPKEETKDSESLPGVSGNFQKCQDNSPKESKQAICKKHVEDENINEARKNVQPEKSKTFLITAEKEK